MDNKELVLYENALDIALLNSSFIEVLIGYCNNTMCGDCDVSAILTILEVMKQNQEKLIKEIEVENIKSYSCLS